MVMDIISIITLFLGVLTISISSFVTFRYNKLKFGEYSLPFGAILIMIGAIFTIISIFC